MIMKKYLFLAASALALASCSSDDIIGNNGGGQQSATNAEITFGANPSANSTRAGQLSGATAAEVLGNNFVVVGFKGNATDAANNETYAFDHYNVNYKANTAGSTTSNTANWEYVGQDINVKGINQKLAQGGAEEQTIKYWDNSCSSYDFIAFSLGKGYQATGDGTKNYAKPSSIDKAHIADAAYTLEGDAHTLSECYISDIKTVEKGTTGYANTTVEMSFRHLTSKVRIALYETVPGYVINEVKFHSSSTDGTQNDEGQFYGLFNEKGKYTVYFPTTGTANKTTNAADYNKAHVNFEADATDGTSNIKTFGSLNYNNQEENQILASKGYLSQNAATPSFCGTNDDSHYYQTVLPAEDKSQSVTIRIDYTLTATDGTNEQIHVKNATATVPAEYTKWKPGYAYTYKFKISQNTNGTTGGDGDDTGLTAISFDAVVAADEESGQETITTVSTPSITTYGFKDGDVTAGVNEYTTDTDIYATVYVPAKGTAGADGYVAETTVAPQKLYTITVTGSGSLAAQTINEASVANAIEKGGIADINGYKLSATEDTSADKTITTVPTKDGHNLSINALKWTAGTAGTIYAVEYEDQTTHAKTYKIVKIAE